MTKFWHFFIHQSSFSYLLMTALVLFGLYSLASIPKESAPEVQIPIAIVSTPFPGASAVDVERLVTNKIEDRLWSGLKELKNLTSTSRDSFSVVVVEFNADADLEKSIQEAKDEVDKVRVELPTDAEDPEVTEVDFVDQPILTLSVLSDLPVPEFIRLTEELEDELTAVPGVSRVETSGMPRREVQVVVSNERLAGFGMSIAQVAQAITAANSELPVGSIRQDGGEYAIKFKGGIEDPREIGDIALTTPTGRTVYVRDLALVSDGVSKSTTFSRASEGGAAPVPAAALSIFKKRGEDVTRTADAVKARLQELSGGLLKDTDVLVSFDTAKYIRDDLKNLSATALQTILLVMLILFTVIGWREAAIAGLAIPLSFVIAFIGLNFSGNTINFVSLFSLILGVGILVDAAIVVTEAIHTRTALGMSGKEAALDAVREFQTPLISGTMTTVAVFVPLFFISGITGEFIASIPFTLIFLLFAAQFVALALIPLIAARGLARAHASRLAAKREAVTGRVTHWYRARLTRLLDSRRMQRWLMWGLGIGFVVALALPAIGAVKVIFFPGEDSDFLFIDAESPQGVTLEASDAVARRIEEALRAHPAIDSFVTTVGASSAFSQDATVDSKFANVTILLKETRKEKSSDIVQDLRRDLHGIAEAEVRVYEPESGPPTGAPVLIKFFGDDFASLETTAQRARAALAEVSGTVEVDTSAKNTGSDIVLTINRARAAAAGLSASAIARELRAAVFGMTAATLRVNGEDVDVVVKSALNPEFTDPHDTAHTTVDAIQKLVLPTAQGPVLLSSLLETRFEGSNAVIRHEDRQRLVTVSAQLLPGAVARDVVAEFRERFDKGSLSAGIRMEIGGENEEVDQSFQDMFIALCAGVVLILAILVLQFNSWRQAFFIIAAVPLSLVGILFGLALTGKTLSFPSMMGFIALAGIVVNNSIIMIDVINTLRRARPEAPLRDLVIEGTVSRLRPILLTTVTTIFGMIPLTYAAALWSPLAFAIIFGLSFATIITLGLVPVLYYRWPGKVTS